MPEVTVVIEPAPELDLMDPDEEWDAWFEPDSGPQFKVTAFSTYEAAEAYVLDVGPARIYTVRVLKALRVSRLKKRPVTKERVAKRRSA